MPLAVLNDEEVRQLLEGLTRDELDSVREELSSALNEYSTATQIAPPGVEVADLDDHEHDSIHQPPRTSVRSSRTGTTTLFMPSSGPSGLGIKVITLSSPSSGNGAGTRNSTSSAAAEAATAHDGGHSRRQSASRGTLSSSSPQRHGSRTGSPATPTQRGASSTVGHEQLTLPYVAPTGALALFTPQGLPMAFVHARTLTAFRTALASSCLVIRRGHVRTITVFGAGLQAYWHVRLALKLRGREIRAVNFINHRFSDSAKSILKRLNAVPAEIKAREGWATGSPKGASGKGGGETHGVGCQFSVLTPGYSDYERLVREQLLAADVIFCCTPGKRTPTASPPSGARESPPLPGDEDNVHAAPDVGALFDPSILTSHEGRRKGRLIVAIGSYTPDTRELPLELLRQATRHEPGHWHFHRHAPEGGVVIVDTLDGAMKEAGEIIQAGLEPRQLVELGELVMLQRLSLEDDAAPLPSGASASTMSSTSTGNSSYVSSVSLDKLDLPAGAPAMSTVFPSSSDSGSEKRDGRRSDSPRGGKDHRGSFSFHLPHRRSTSRASSADRGISTSSVSTTQQKKMDIMARWLRDGNVIYKSVGLGLMDLVVGREVVEMARQKHIGTHVEHF